MTATINASTSAGIVQTADTSGDLALQSNGTTKLTVSSTGVTATNLTATGTFGGGVITSGTSVPTTSGTSVLVATGIPSWVKRVTITFNNISTSATANIVMQIGTGGTLTTTGYQGGMSCLSVAATANNTYFLLIRNNAAANVYSGIATLVTTGGNIWYLAGNISSSGSDGTCVSSGLVPLSGALERISLTTTSTDTFDAGSVNILYEG